MNEHLQEKLGYRFNDPARLDLALTHPSARYELNLPDDNQRLEYLGDAALGLAAAQYLFTQFTKLPEGQLTVLRSNLTSTNALADVARSLELGQALLLGRGEEQSGGRDKSNNLADVLEAVIGAIYLDGGISAVNDLFARLFAPRLDTAEAAVAGTANYKGLLQEWAQKDGIPCPTYQVISEEGPAHHRLFQIEVAIPDGRKAVGSGLSKRIAEQNAAQNLLTLIRGT